MNELLDYQRLYFIWEIQTLNICGHAFRLKHKANTLGTSCAFFLMAPSSPFSLLSPPSCLIQQIKVDIKMAAVHRGELSGTRCVCEQLWVCREVGLADGQVNEFTQWSAFQWYNGRQRLRCCQCLKMLSFVSFFSLSLLDLFLQTLITWTFG